jgi:hypothetical protein
VRKREHEERGADDEGDKEEDDTIVAESNTNNEEEAADLPQRFDYSDRLIGRSDDRIWLQLSHTVYLAL